MANVFKPKRSSTAALVPTTTNLASGEMGVNMADQKVYINNGTSVVQIGAGKLSGLGDVTLTSISNGQTLTWNGTAFVNSSAGSGTVTGVTGTAPIVSSGGTAPAISISAATTLAAGSMSAADKTKLDGIASGATANTGTVTSVAALTLGTTGTDVSSTVATSTTTPVITLNIPTASASNRGALSAADWSTFNGKQAALGYTPLNPTTSQTANTVYAAPNGSAGAPTFRALAAADIPALTLENLPDAWTKRSVKVATTANITLSGTQTIDGIAVVAGDRVLVKDQTATAANGIYVVAAGAWTRPADADTASEIAGAMVNVDQGTANGGFIFDNDFKSTDTLGTTAMAFSRVVDTGLASSTTPAMDGTATIGTAVSYARADHIHPTDTSRSPLAGSTSITTLGTVTAGTWNATVINSTYGGMGVNNGGRTLTLNTNSGTLVYTNAATTLTVANTASVSGTNTGDQTIGLTGDVTGSGTGSFAATLATVNANVGSFGSATSIPVVTVNAKGLVTAVSTATVAGGQYFGSAATKAIAYNANTISENVTVTAGNNGLSAGPITIASTFTVTVETGAAWVIV